MLAATRDSLSRSGEVQDFRELILTYNTRWALLVARVLLSFAVVLSTLSLLGIYQTRPTLYVLEVVVLMASMALLYWGPSGKSLLWRQIGAGIVRLAAVFWMFAEVWSAPVGDQGLTGFILGVLALALFYLIPFWTSAIVYSVLWLLYVALVTIRAGLSIDVAVNSLLVCLLAGVWCRIAWHGRVLEFRNRQLIEELKRKSQHLGVLALQDGLTGIPNRRAFEQVIEQIWSDPAQSEVPVAYLLGDIDHFKAWNDRYGHPEGDVVLKSVADKLVLNLRSDGFVARLGGEEFAVLVSGIDLPVAIAVAERLRQCLESGPVTMSWGVCVQRPSQVRPKELYLLADRALYRAKASGRNRVVADTAAATPAGWQPPSI